jgi:hypothetical protein
VPSRDSHASSAPGTWASARDVDVDVDGNGRGQGR